MLSGLAWNDSGVTFSLGPRMQCGILMRLSAYGVQGQSLSQEGDPASTSGPHPSPAQTRHPITQWLPSFPVRHSQHEDGELCLISVGCELLRGADPASLL